MTQNQKFWLVGGGTLLVIALLVGWGWYEGRQAEQAASQPDANVVYYYGEECPHCKNINQFLERHGIAEKVAFTKKEVWHDRKHSQEMQAKAKSCGMDAKEIGVPFIYQQDENKCLVGEPDVRKFFAEKAGLNEDGTPRIQ